MSELKKSTFSVSSTILISLSLFPYFVINIVVTLQEYCFSITLTLSINNKIQIDTIQPFQGFLHRLTTKNIPSHHVVQPTAGLPANIIFKGFYRLQLLCDFKFRNKSKLLTDCLFFRLRCQMEEGAQKFTQLI